MGEFADDGFEPYAGIPVSELVSDNAADCARKVFEEGLIGAAQSIVHMAAFGQSEKTRFEASKYIVERNLGRVATSGENRDVWDSLLTDILTGKKPGETDSKE